MKGKTICVWFSCGAPSAVASKMILDKYDAKGGKIKSWDCGIFCDTK